MSIKITMCSNSEQGESLDQDDIKFESEEITEQSKSKILH